MRVWVLGEEAQGQEGVEGMEGGEQQVEEQQGEVGGPEREGAQAQ